MAEEEIRESMRKAYSEADRSSATHAKRKLIKEKVTKKKINKEKGGGDRV